jgi:hypothetical protein
MLTGKPAPAAQRPLPGALSALQALVKELFPLPQDLHSNYTHLSH